MSNTTNTISTINTADKKVRTRTCVEPLTADEAANLQTWLVKHNFCIKNAKKNIRVYRYLGHKPGFLPVTEHLAKTVLSIPMYNGMTDEEQDYVINTINNFK